jgi:hypothetical protein
MPNEIGRFAGKVAIVTGGKSSSHGNTGTCESTAKFICHQKNPPRSRLSSQKGPCRFLFLERGFGWKVGEFKGRLHPKPEHQTEGKRIKQCANHDVSAVPLWGFSGAMSLFGIAPP